MSNICFLQFQYLIDVDMTSYLKFFHISLQESYISNKANPCFSKGMGEIMMDQSNRMFYR